MICEHSPLSPRRAIPWGLVGMLALVVAFETFVTRREMLAFSTNVAVSWHHTGRAVRRAVKSDVLFFGDSMVKFGLEPPIIEQRLGRKSYNLAPYAGPPAASYVLLRRALETGAKPSAVVVDFQPHVLAVPPQFNARHWPELASLRDCVDLAWTTRDASFFGKLLTGRVLASYRDRFEVRANLTAAFRGESYSGALFNEIPALIRNWNINRGAQATPRNPAYNGSVNVGDTALFPARWECDPASAAYMERFLALAAAHRIQVFWLLPPISPGSQQRREQMGLDAEFTRFVRGVQARYANVIVVDGRRSGYQHTVYIDPVHLDRQGAERLSIDMAGLLDLYLNGPSGPRWIDLPTYRDEPSGVALEDVGQSRVALKIP